MDKYNNEDHIIAIIGSSKHKEKILEYARYQELRGNICLLSHIFSHTLKDFSTTPEQDQNLINNGHKRIDMADRVVVIIENEYIGKSTREELTYAKSLDKSIQFIDIEDVFLYKEI